MSLVFKPSPFPGMDPHLEDENCWRGTYKCLLCNMLVALNKMLPVQWVASVEARDYDEPDPQLRPYEIYIAIRRSHSEDRPLTVIEMLRPSTKSEHPERESYLAQRREWLESGTHLIEIDLLRTGWHTVAVSPKLLPLKETWDYLVCLQRNGQSGAAETWPVSLRDCLPRFTVPYAEDQPDLTLDLQAVFNKNYIEGRYEIREDYTRNPVVPLSPEDAKWADELLREKGLRP